MSTDTLTITELKRPGSLGDPSPSLPAPPNPESRPDQPDSDAACPLVQIYKSYRDVSFEGFELTKS